MKFRLAAERVLLAVGGVLCAFVALAIADRYIGSRVAVQAFAAAESLPTLKEAPRFVDFSLWSQKRINAYKALLSKSFPSPVGILRISRLSMEVPVFQGTSERELNRGAGWIAGTAAAGEDGNIGIASHRDGFFRVLKDVQIGDVVSLASPGYNSLYEVDDIEIVSPNDVGVLKERPLPNLTLVTCYPFYFAGDAPQRYVVHCSLKQRIPAGGRALSQAGAPAALITQGGSK